MLSLARFVRPSRAGVNLRRFYLSAQVMGLVLGFGLIVNIVLTMIPPNPITGLIVLTLLTTVIMVAVWLLERWVLSRVSDVRAAVVEAAVLAEISDVNRPGAFAFAPSPRRLLEEDDDDVQDR